jgi:hypothetical protein
MLQPELKTQIYYLNRIFEILSDGYMLSGISFDRTELQGDENLPYSTIDDSLKVELQFGEFESVLNNIFAGLYNHAKQFTSSPKIFAQEWNNAYVLKSIEETKDNILEYSKSNDVVIKTSHDLVNDHFQVVELIYDNKQIKEVIFFQKWFH